MEAVKEAVKRIIILGLLLLLLVRAGKIQSWVESHWDRSRDRAIEAHQEEQARTDRAANLDADEVAAGFTPPAPKIPVDKTKGRR